ncbi:MAG: hypothetical protein JWR21_497 [Herminiimonas sp.]|nr:hypothetical protein [Herminiimonas sp.]MDB5852720.1 hypothetical protein [Herminiimonas sp.]
MAIDAERDALIVKEVLAKKGRSSQQREMVKTAVTGHCVVITLACVKLAVMTEAAHVAGLRKNGKCNDGAYTGQCLQVFELGLPPRS